MNIQLAVNDLISAGFTEEKLAKEIGGVSQPTIHRLKTGETKNPSFRVGSTILQLHEKHCGADESAAA